MKFIRYYLLLYVLYNRNKITDYIFLGTYLIYNSRYSGNKKSQINQKKIKKYIYLFK